MLSLIGVCSCPFLNFFSYLSVSYSFPTIGSEISTDLLPLFIDFIPIIIPLQLSAVDAMEKMKCFWHCMLLRLGEESIIEFHMFFSWCANAPRVWAKNQSLNSTCFSI
eukprot:230236_1